MARLERIRATDLDAVTPAPLVARGPGYQAYQILHWGFAVLPIIAGVDKFFDRLVAWPQYLAPAVSRMLPLSVDATMMVIGVIEIVAGLLVGLKPRYGAYLVMLWLWGIIVNLLLIPGYYDIALRDFGLSLGALALARLATRFERAE